MSFTARPARSLRCCLSVAAVLCSPFGKAAISASPKAAPLKEQSIATVWSTYLGGQSPDYGHAVAADAAGNAYITGFTGSTDFPTPDGYDTSYNGAVQDKLYGDAFVAKFSPEGALLWSTYLGGSGDDYGSDIATDAAGNACVIGYTNSPDFPTPGGCYKRYGGAHDAFLAKFSPDGKLLWSTYLGGSGYEFTGSLAVAGEGHIYVCGMTMSGDFPTPGGWDNTFNGGGDIFLAKFNANGTLLWSTYFGGSGEERGYQVAADRSGAIYVAGRTGSADLPTQGGYDCTLEGTWDCLVAKFGAGGELVWSTYIGGARDDWGVGLACDPRGDIYVTGLTYSADFPTPGGFCRTPTGPRDAFVGKFSADGALLWSTYLGGSGVESGQSIAVGRSETIYVVGETGSADFPKVSARETTYRGNADGFVAALDPNGNLLWSRYLGGSGVEQRLGIAADRAGRVYVVGTTGSPDFPVLGGYKTEYSGGECDAFLSKFAVPEVGSKKQERK